MILKQNFDFYFWPIPFPIFSPLCILNSSLVEEAVFAKKERTNIKVAYVSFSITAVPISLD